MRRSAEQVGGWVEFEAGAVLASPSRRITAMRVSTAAPHPEAGVGQAGSRAERSTSSLRERSPSEKSSFSPGHL